MAVGVVVVVFGLLELSDEEEEEEEEEDDDDGWELKLLRLTISKQQLQVQKRFHLFLMLSRFVCLFAWLVILKHNLLLMQVVLSCDEIDYGLNVWFVPKYYSYSLMLCYCLVLDNRKFLAAAHYDTIHENEMNKQICFLRAQPICLKRTASSKWGTW